MRFGFAYNPTTEAAHELSERAAGWCSVHGIDQWAAAAGDTEALRADLPRTDVLFVLGGDGTFLRAARAVAEVDVPLLGVNLGKIGFLSKVEADELETILARIADGEYAIEERMALEGRIHPKGGEPTPERLIALNDIVIARGALARVCRLDVSIDDSHLATFIADGLIVASPTGSTGYSFSAGGPIVEPSSRTLIVTPIASYLSAIRPIVAAQARSAAPAPLPSAPRSPRCRLCSPRARCRRPGARGRAGPGLRRKASLRRPACPSPRIRVRPPR